MNACCLVYEVGKKKAKLTYHEPTVSNFVAYVGESCQSLGINGVERGHNFFFRAIYE